MIIIDTFIYFKNISNVKDIYNFRGYIIDMKENNKLPQSFTFTGSHGVKYNNNSGRIILHGQLNNIDNIKDITYWLSNSLWKYKINYTSTKIIGELP